MICPTCGCEIQPGARFCSACGQRAASAQSASYQYVPVQEAAAQAGLVRPLAGRAVAGVCAGFALRYGWDVTIVRLLLVLVVLVGCGLPLLAYLVAWVVMPNESFVYPMQPAAPAPTSATPQA